MVIDRFLFRNNQLTLLPCFTFIPKTGIGLPKVGIISYCEVIVVSLMKNSKVFLGWAYHIICALRVEFTGSEEADQIGVTLPGRPELLVLLEELAQLLHGRSDDIFGLSELPPCDLLHRVRKLVELELKSEVPQLDYRELFYV